MSKQILLDIETVDESNNYCSKHCNYFCKEDGETEADCLLFGELLFEKFKGQYLAMRSDECIGREYKSSSEDK